MDHLMEGIGWVDANFSPEFFAGSGSVGGVTSGFNPIAPMTSDFSAGMTLGHGPTFAAAPASHASDASGNIGLRNQTLQGYNGPVGNSLQTPQGVFSTSYHPGQTTHGRSIAGYHSEMAAFTQDRQPFPQHTSVEYSPGYCPQMQPTAFQNTPRQYLAPVPVPVTDPAPAPAPVTDLDLNLGLDDFNRKLNLNDFGFDFSLAPAFDPARPLRCSECDSTFVGSNDIEAHKHKMHNPKSKYQKDKQLVVGGIDCPCCPANKKHRSAWYEHLKKAHRKEWELRYSARAVREAAKVAKAKAAAASRRRI